VPADEPVRAGGKCFYISENNYRELPRRIIHSCMKYFSIIGINMRGIKLPGEGGAP
jgi:hypothetical protein